MNTLFDDVIDRMVESGELHPGGAENIRGMGWGGRLPPADALARLFDHLEGPGPAARAANPLLSGDVAPPGLRARGPNYAADDGRSPLRKMLARFPLAEGAAEALEREWGFAIGRDTPGRMAAAIARRLADRANHRHLESPPARPRSEERLSDVLSTHFQDLPYAKREELAAKLGRELGGLPELDVVERLAQRLSVPASARFYGVEPIDPGDDRIRAKAKAMAVRSEDPARDERGRFARDRLYGGNPL
jgi:hypothetical protein